MAAGGADENAEGGEGGDLRCGARGTAQYVQTQQQGGRGGFVSRAHLRSLPADIEAPAKGRGDGLEFVVNRRNGPERCLVPQGSKLGCFLHRAGATTISSKGVHYMRVSVPT